jgi:hypothetical protein
MALPILVLPVNQVSASMMMTQEMMVTMVTKEIFSCPPKKVTPVRGLPSAPATLKKEGNCLGLEVHSSRAMFCRK